jgi:phage gp36-like protein
MAAHATSADLIKRFDTNVIGDLASDTGTPIASAAFSADANITAALADATGEINSAVMVSDLYTSTELTDLSDQDEEYLKRICCDLAMGYLFGRRPEKYGEAIDRITKYAREQLELIRTGKRLFNVTARKTAGQPEIDGPSAVDYQNMNLIPDRTRNFYPARGTRLPIGRG